MGWAAGQLPLLCAASECKRPACETGSNVTIVEQCCVSVCVSCVVLLLIMLAISNPPCLLTVRSAREDRPALDPPARIDLIRSSSPPPPQWPTCGSLTNNTRPASNQKSPHDPTSGLFFCIPPLPSCRAPKGGLRSIPSEAAGYSVGYSSQKRRRRRKKRSPTTVGRGKRSDRSFRLCAAPRQFIGLSSAAPEPPDARAPRPLPRREDRIQSMIRSMVAMIDLLREPVGGWLLVGYGLQLTHTLLPRSKQQQIQHIAGAAFMDT